MVEMITVEMENGLAVSVDIFDSGQVWMAMDCRKPYFSCSGRLTQKATEQLITALQTALKEVTA